jgi:hypothetical protein
MRRSTVRRGMRIRLPIRKKGRGKVPAFSARYKVDRVSPSSIAVSSTLSSGRGDLGKELSRMDHRSCSVPGRVPWSQPILRMDITPNVILDKGYSSALRVTSATSRLRMSPWPMPVQAAEDGKKCHPRKNRLLPTSPFQVAGGFWADSRRGTPCHDGQVPGWVSALQRRRGATPRWRSPGRPGLHHLFPLLAHQGPAEDLPAAEAEDAASR